MKLAELLSDIQMLDEVSAEANVSRKHHAACINSANRLRAFVTQSMAPKSEDTENVGDGLARSGEGNEAQA
jgi:hypothetical protein